MKALAIFIFFLIQSVRSSTQSNMSNLFEDIFNAKYNPNAPPKKPVKVGMRVQLEEIRGIDDVNEILVTRIRVHVWWWDKRLKWKYGNYGISSVLVPQHTVWKPDVALMNDVSELRGLEEKASPIRISGKSGQMQWSPVSIFETKCKFDLEFYPFDTQHCQIKMGTLSSYDKHINLYKLQCMKLKGTFQTSTWSLEAMHKYETDFVLNDQVYKEQRVLTCVYTIKRKSSYYVTNILLPLLFLGLMNPLAFLIPCHSGEKISFAVTLFLAFAVYETIIMEKVPVNSDKTSYLQVYVITQLAFTVFILITSIIQTRIYEMFIGCPTEESTEQDAHTYNRIREPDTRTADDTRQYNTSPESVYKIGGDPVDITDIKEQHNSLMVKWKRLPFMTKIDIYSFFVVLVGQLAINAWFYIIVT